MDIEPRARVTFRHEDRIIEVRADHLSRDQLGVVRRVTRGTVEAWLQRLRDGQATADDLLAAGIFGHVRPAEAAATEPVVVDVPVLGTVSIDPVNTPLELQAAVIFNTGMQWPEWIEHMRRGDPTPGDLGQAAAVGALVRRPHTT